MASPIPLEFEGGSGCTAVNFFNDGHVLAASTHEGVSPVCGLGVTYNGTKYELQKIQVHSPSEHLFGGAAYEGEVQLVHTVQSGSTTKNLIISVFLEAAPSGGGSWAFTDNNFMAKFLGAGFDERSGVKFTGAFERFGTKKEEKEASSTTFAQPAQPINPYAELVPPNPSYFTYHGSLTAPPCSQGVQWVVMEQSVKVGSKQMQAVRQFLALANAGRTPVPRLGQVLGIVGTNGIGDQGCGSSGKAAFADGAQI